jgi:hypothetical protein
MIVAKPSNLYKFVINFVRIKIKVLIILMEILKISSFEISENSINNNKKFKNKMKMPNDSKPTKKKS